MLSSKIVNRGLAVLSIGAASLALAGCSLLGGATGSNGSGASESPSNTADVFTIKVGDCLNDAAVEGEVTTVPTVDCAQPHDSEAYSSIIMDDGEFPGADAVKTKAETGCTIDFNTFVGVDYNSSALDFAYYYPTADSWTQGDREILCLITDPAGQTTGSLKGAAR